MVRHRRQPAGFTLIELLIVVAVMGILAGLVLPRSDPSLHEQLRSTAQIMAGDLAYGRSLAVTNNSQYRVQFEVAENRYVLEHSGVDPALDTLPDSPLRSPEDPPTMQIVDLDELPHVGTGVRIAAVVALGSTPQSVESVEFGPLGTTTRSEETVVWVAAGAGSATRYMQVHVNPVTGLTSVGAYSAAGPP
jgi:prepilin-type N-terminal cleavage/methylation domain-containing protein